MRTALSCPRVVTNRVVRLYADRRLQAHYKHSGRRPLSLLLAKNLSGRKLSGWSLSLGGSGAARDASLRRARNYRRHNADAAAWRLMLRFHRGGLLSRSPTAAASPGRSFRSTIATRSTGRTRRSQGTQAPGCCTHSRTAEFSKPRSERTPAEPLAGRVGPRRIEPVAPCASSWLHRSLDVQKVWSSGVAQLTFRSGRAGVVRSDSYALLTDR